MYTPRRDPRVRAGEFTVAPNTCPLRAPPAVAAILKKFADGSRGSWEMRDLPPMPGLQIAPQHQDVMCLEVEQQALKVEVKATYE